MSGISPEETALVLCKPTAGLAQPPNDAFLATLMGEGPLKVAATFWLHQLLPTHALGVELASLRLLLFVLLPAFVFTPALDAGCAVFFVLPFDLSRLALKLLRKGMPLTAASGPREAQRRCIEWARKIHGSRRTLDVEHVYHPPVAGTVLAHLTPSLFRGADDSNSALADFLAVLPEFALGAAHSLMPAAVSLLTPASVNPADIGTVQAAQMVQAAKLTTPLQPFDELTPFPGILEELTRRRATSEEARFVPLFNAQWRSALPPLATAFLLVTDGREARRHISALAMAIGARYTFTPDGVHSLATLIKPCLYQAEIRAPGATSTPDERISAIEVVYARRKWEIGSSGQTDGNDEHAAPEAPPSEDSHATQVGLDTPDHALIAAPAYDDLHTQVSALDTSAEPAAAAPRPATCDSIWAHIDLPGPMTYHRARALIDELRPSLPHSTIREALYASEVAGVVSPAMGGASRRTKADIIHDARAAVGLPLRNVAAPAGPAPPTPCVKRIEPPNPTSGVRGNSSDGNTSTLCSGDPRLPAHELLYGSEVIRFAGTSIGEPCACAGWGSTGTFMFCQNLVESPDALMCDACHTGAIPCECPCKTCTPDADSEAPRSCHQPNAAGVVTDTNLWQRMTERARRRKMRARMKMLLRIRVRLRMIRRMHIRSRMRLRQPTATRMTYVWRRDLKRRFAPHASELRAERPEERGDGNACPSSLGDSASFVGLSLTPPQRADADAEPARGMGTLSATPPYPAIQVASAPPPVATLVERALGERWRPVARRAVARAISLGAPDAHVNQLAAIYQRLAEFAAEPNDLTALRRRFRRHLSRLVDAATAAARALIDALRPALSRVTIRDALYAARIADVVSPQLGGHSGRTRADVISEARAAVGLPPLTLAAPSEPTPPAPCAGRTAPSLLTAAATPPADWESVGGQWCPTRSRALSTSERPNPRFALSPSSTKTSPNSPPDRSTSSPPSRAASASNSQSYCGRSRRRPAHR